MSSIPQLECRFLRASQGVEGMSNKRKDSAAEDQVVVCSDRMPLSG